MWVNLIDEKLAQEFLRSKNVQHEQSGREIVK